MSHWWPFLSATRDTFGMLFATVWLFHPYQTGFADQTRAHLPMNGQPVLQTIGTIATRNLRGLIRSRKSRTNLKFAVEISEKSWANTVFTDVS